MLGIKSRLCHWEFLKESVTSVINEYGGLPLGIELRIMFHRANKGFSIVPGS